MTEGKAAVGLCVRLKTKDFKIATCSCYYSNWKGIKDTDDELGILMKLSWGSHHLGNYSIKK